MKRYRVNEIFYSIQGEGRHTGTPAVFLRFSGCNLKCPFCDTEHDSYENLTADQILKRVTSYPSTHLVVTGGEPGLQLDEELVQKLHYQGFYIQVETNGTFMLPEVDWITCSPKQGGKVILNHIDELKIVYEGQDVEQIRNSLPEAAYYCLQPVSGTNTAEVVRYIKEHPLWHLSLQTHKLIDIP